MFSFKTVLATTLVAAVTSPRNAEGIDGVSAAPTAKKESVLLFERLCDRRFDTYDLNESQAKFLEEIHALKKGRRPDDLFSTALSDSAIVRQSDGDPWLIRVFYTPEDRSPWRGTVWLGKLMRVPDSSVFVISEVVPVRILEGLAGFMEPFRATKTVVSERGFKLESMLRSLDEMIRESEGAEEVIQNPAESIRKYGNCCPRDSDEGLSDEDVARKMERLADEARASRGKRIEARDSLRSVISLQPGTKQKLESEAHAR